MGLEEREPQCQSLGVKREGQDKAYPLLLTVTDL